MWSYCGVIWLTPMLMHIILYYIVAFALNAMVDWHQCWWYRSKQKRWILCPSLWKKWDAIKTPKWRTSTGDRLRIWHGLRSGDWEARYLSVTSNLGLMFFQVVTPTKRYSGYHATCLSSNILVHHCQRIFATMKQPFICAKSGFLTTTSPCLSMCGKSSGSLRLI